MRLIEVFAKIFEFESVFLKGGFVETALVNWLIIKIQLWFLKSGFVKTALINWLINYLVLSKFVLANSFAEFDKKSETSATEFPPIFSPY